MQNHIGHLIRILHWCTDQTITASLEQMDLTSTLMLGELSLDGTLQPVRGALPMVISASEQGIVDVILPEGNAEEVACIQGIRVYPAKHLHQVAMHLKGKEYGTYIQLSLEERKI